MPGKIKTKIICARNLPIMDRSSDSSDAFVEVRFGANHHDKTHVFKRSLDPEWNSRFVFEVEEDEIQEEPLLIRVLDHDTYSSHDAIGKVYIDLKPLLNENGPTSINGFLPIYDTLHGIRGELKVQAKVEIFNDCNEYRKSSCGVQYFASSKVPEGYVLQQFCGFVEELLINDDPEYHWIDKIRTPRTSNEARQKLFTRLSGEVQRRIGLKVLEMNANCVLGYQQNFDLEGEHGIVVRGIGTVANIVKASVGNNSTGKNPSPPKTAGSKGSFSSNSNSIQKEGDDSRDLVDSTFKKLPPANNPQIVGATNNPPTTMNILKLNKLSPNKPITLTRIHSDSDLNAYQHQQQILGATTPTNLNQPQQLQAQPPQPPAIVEVVVTNRQSILDKMEYPFLTIQQYPVGFIKSIGGIVCSRSVKLLGQSSGNNTDDTESRDKWWIEIRNEIRSHMKSLNCHVVLGYTETESICEDVCILSGFGTAALVDDDFFEPTGGPFEASPSSSSHNCKLCHVPYSDDDPLPLPVGLSTCAKCEQGYVPDVIFSSIQPVAEIETVGRGCLIRAVVTRPRKKSSAELGAKLVSDNLPFVEYELHRQLLGKLKLKGMNMLYGLRVEISIGENVLIGMAEATACFAAALPAPILPRIYSEMESTASDKSTSRAKDDEIEKLRRLLTDELNRNRAFFQLESTESGQSASTSVGGGRSKSMLAGSGEQQRHGSLDHHDVLVAANNDSSKALFKIELDDVGEKENIYFLLDFGRANTNGFYTCSTELMPGVEKFETNLQMFTTVHRCEISQALNQVKFGEICEEILQSLKYKFRRHSKLCLANLSLNSSLYDDDYAMVIVTGSCLTFTDPKTSKENGGNQSTTTINEEKNLSPSSSSVEVTSLSYVPNSQIDSYLGFINLFLIRESTQIKENGGMCGFMHCFLSEVLALSRAHVLSLGGNALVSYRLNQCVLLNNPHRNQAQCLVNVSGDAVRVVRNTSSSSRNN